jgi:hypothetical protein
VEVGNYVLVATDTSGMIAMKIHDPAAPRIVGAADTEGVTGSVDVDSSGTYAFFPDGSTTQREFIVVDVSNPVTAPVLASEDSPDRATRFAGKAGNIRGDGR